MKELAIKMPKALTKSLVILAGSCTSALAYWTLVTYLNRRKYRHIPGPPTKGIYGFFLGNTGEVLENFKRGDMFYELIEKW